MKQSNFFIRGLCEEPKQTICPERTFNKQKFNALIHAESPAIIFPKALVGKLFGKRWKIRRLSPIDMYVDFNSNQIVVLGAVYGKWEACSKQFDKLRAETDENDERTVIGHGCLRGQVIQLEIVGGNLVSGKSHIAEKCKRGVLWEFLNINCFAK